MLLLIAQIAYTLSQEPAYRVSVEVTPNYKPVNTVCLSQTIRIESNQI